MVVVVVVVVGGGKNAGAAACMSSKLSTSATAVEASGAKAPTEQLHQLQEQPQPQEEDAAVVGDREVLEELFVALGKPRWLRRNNWLSPLPLNQWRGITTDANGRVKEISLRALHLSGKRSLLQIHFL